MTGSSVALSAGAGCGKTTVLAERFLRALEPPEPAPAGPGGRPDVHQQGGPRASRADPPASAGPGSNRAATRPLAADPPGAGGGPDRDLPLVLRRGPPRHAIEAGVDPGFTVLDEPIALAIRDEALAVARSASGWPPRDPDLIELAVEFGLGTVRQSLDDLLGNRSAGDIRDWVDRQPRQARRPLARPLDPERPARAPGPVRRGGRPCLDLIARERLRPRQDPGPAGRAARRLRPARGSPEPGAILGEITALAKVEGLAAKLWPSDDVYRCIKDHFEAIRDEAEALLKALPWDEPTPMLAADHGLRFARLAVRAREAYDRAKRARGGIDNDDLLLLTRDLLAGRPEAVRPVPGRVDRPDPRRRVPGHRPGPVGDPRAPGRPGPRRWPAVPGRRLQAVDLPVPGGQARPVPRLPRSSSPTRAGST